MAYRSITQIILLVIALVVIFSYIKPKMAEIKVVQDEVVQYEEAVNKATEFNMLLSSLLTKSADFTQEEVKALERYVPGDQDMVSVARDLNIIADRAGVAFVSVGLEEVRETTGRSARSGAQGANEDAVGNDLVSQEITVSISGTYINSKEFIKLVESNAYPLELISLELNGNGSEGAESLELISEEAEYSFTLVYETYSLNTQI